MELSLDHAFTIFEIKQRMTTDENVTTNEQLNKLFKL